LGDESTRLSAQRPKEKGLPRHEGGAEASTEQPAATSSVGLCLSGGGIRSATFCLGVLQALASKRKLASFDYLSTVSGGGYIGSWLSAWIHRAGLKTVQDELARVGTQQSTGVPAAGEPAEVTWLRRYSNYLTPRIGVFSLDSLTLVATWSRNFLLNLIVIVSVLGALFLIPYLLVIPFNMATQAPLVFMFLAAWAGLLFAGGIVYNLWQQSLPDGGRGKWLIRVSGVFATVMLPGLVTAWSAAVWLFSSTAANDHGDSVTGYIGLLVALLLAFWAFAEAGKVVIGRFMRKRTPENSSPQRTWGEFKHLLYRLAIFASSAFLATACGVLLLTAFKTLFGTWQNSFDKLALLVTVGPSAFLLTFGIATTAFIGLVGRVYWERAREWWSRLNAWFVTIAVVWVVWCAYSFYSLPLFDWIVAHLGAWASLLGTGWLGSLAASIYGRKPLSTSERMQINIDLALNVAATIFVAGFLFCVAAATNAVVADTAVIAQDRAPIRLELPAVLPQGDKSKIPDSSERSAKLGFSNSKADHLAGLRDVLLRGTVLDWPAIPFDFVLLALVATLFGWRVDINKFSLHNMYKNRLVRCYLGASNQKARNEQPFVGLDADDDMRFAALAGTGEPSSPQRPFHIVNATLNISQGANLAWQERKAASFVFTPLYCGYSMARTQGDTTPLKAGEEWTQKGYVPTQNYAADDREEHGLTLGTVLATSGAAVSPNMGHATHPARAFVLTLFNARLGRWSPNPLRDKYGKPSPRFGIVQLMQELLGYSNERRNFVYLSDGGHFDNLGLYELVRRRCRTIVAVDCGQDPNRQFDDLASAIRKCRIDLGVDIRFEHLSQLSGETIGEKVTLPKKGYIRGTVHYGSGESKDVGTLILVKPTMTRSKNEPVDVLNYASNNPQFPQETTADQWFSESQFESYRRLGFHLAGQCLEEFDSLLPKVEPSVEAPAKPAETPSQPSWVTSIVGALCGYKREDLPPRAGCSIDYFLAAFALTLLGSLGFWISDKLSLPDFAQGFCLSRQACAANDASLLNAGGMAPFWSNAVARRTIFDNFFVLAYTSMFLLAYVVSKKYAWFRDDRWNWTVLSLLCGVALLGGMADYGENFVLLAGIYGGQSHELIAENMASFTLAKFWLFLGNSLVLLLSARRLIRAFSDRWRRG
jgi:hypothetical protein